MAESRRRPGGRTDAPAIYGIHTVCEAIQEGRSRIERVLLSRDRHDGRIGRIHRLARERGIPVVFTPAGALDRWSRGGAHQGAVALLGAWQYAPVEELIGTGDPAALLMLVDGVQDPRNLGAIIRTAAASGVSGIVLPAHGACGLTPVVARAAEGALERVPIARAANLVRLSEVLKEKGFRVVGLDVRGSIPWVEADLGGRVALTVGGERGLRRLLRAACDQTVRIPMAAGVESLNVSVAAGVLLFEAVRQRGRRGGGRLAGGSRAPDEKTAF